MSHLSQRSLLLGMCGLFAAACIEKGEPKSGVDERWVKANVLSTAPTSLDTQVNSDFGKVVYLGNEVGTKILRPGGAGSIVHYWKVVEPPGSEWKIFTHLNGDGGEWMNLDTTDMRKGYPAKRWKAGDIIRDEQRFTLDANWSSPTATLSVGLYRSGAQGADARMEIVSGPKDAERRSPAAVFQVEGAGEAKTPSARYTIRRASGPITIDGKADEEAWQNAPMSPDFADAEGGPSMGLKTVARMLWDDENLYIFAELEDKDVYSQYTKDDDPMWKEDVIEFFIDADKNRRGYIELQVNPNNAHFHAWFPQTRGQKHYFDWTSKMTSAVVVHGSKDERGDTDRGWDVEVAIPLSDVKGRDEAMAVNIPPKLGDSWRLNVVRGEKPANESLRASSWNAITYRDFHALGRMLEVSFADSEGKLEAAAETATPASAEGAETAEAAPTSDGDEDSSQRPVAGQRSMVRDLRLKANKEAVKKSLQPPAAEEDPRQKRIREAAGH